MAGLNATVKGLSLSELEALRGSGTAKRYMRAHDPKAAQRMEAIVNREVSKVADHWIDFIMEVVKAIDGPTLTTLRGASKAAPVLITKEICCDAADYHEKRVNVEGELSLALDHAINQAGNQLFSEIWGITDIHAQTPLQKTLYELMQEALADGYEAAAAEWEKLAAKDQAWADANPFPDAPIQPTAEMRWVQKIYDNGLSKVKNTLFKRLIPEIKQELIHQFAAGATVRDISQTLYDKHGQGKLWQWQRLARTEGHNAVFQSNIEEYKDTGAKWARWSMAPNACKVCAAIQSVNYGYYKIDEVPEPPHPNCRCTTTPVYNLPQALKAQLAQ